MLYEKLNLQNGNILTAEHLTHIEKGIAAANHNSDLKGKKYYAFGDSIVMNQKTRRGYVTEMVERYGLVASNFGYSGHTLVQDYSTLSAKDFSDVAVVTIAYGVNDCRIGDPLGTADSTEVTTFAGALNSLLAKIYTDNPKCYVLVLTPIQRLLVNGLGSFNENKNGDTLYDFADMCIEVAGRNSTRSIDLFRNCGLNQHNLAYYTDEGVHPTNEGYKKMSAMVISAFDEMFAIAFAEKASKAPLNLEDARGTIVNGSDLTWDYGHIDAKGGLTINSTVPSYSSDFVNAYKATNITITDTNAKSLRYAEYDENGNLISRTTTGYSNHQLVGDLNSTTVFVRVTVVLNGKVGSEDDSEQAAKDAGIVITFN